MGFRAVKRDYREVYFLFFLLLVDIHESQQTDPYKEQSHATKEAKRPTPELTDRYQVIHFILHSDKIMRLMRSGAA